MMEEEEPETTHGEFFFVYDRGAMHGEVGNLEDAIVYYHPADEFEKLSTEAMHRILQMMGVSQASLDIMGSMPRLINLQQEMVALRHWGKYTLALSGPLTVHSRVLNRLLDELCELFTFYHGSIDHVFKQADENAVFFREMLTRTWDFYLAYSRRYGNSLTALFRPLSLVELPKRHGQLFLHASHILQSGQRLPGVLGGAIFIEKSILVTQLDPSLTRHLISLTHQRSTSQTDCAEHPALPLPTAVGERIPSSVRLLSVYVPPSQHEVLRHLCRGRALPLPVELDGREEVSGSPLPSHTGQISPPSPLLSRTPSPWATPLVQSLSSIHSGFSTPRYISSWYEHREVDSPMSASPSRRQLEFNHLPLDASTPTRQQFSDISSSGIGSTPSPARRPDSRRMSMASSVDWNMQGWRPFSSASDGSATKGDDVFGSNPSRANTSTSESSSGVGHSVSETDVVSPSAVRCETFNPPLRSSSPCFFSQRAVTKSASDSVLSTTEQRLMGQFIRSPRTRSPCPPHISAGQSSSPVRGLSGMETTFNFADASSGGETVLVKSGPEVDKVEGLERLNLYVQAHSGTTLVLIAESSLQDDVDSILALFKNSLSQLADLELKVKDALHSTSSQNAPDFSSVTFDAYAGTLSASNCNIDDSQHHAELDDTLHKAIDTMHEIFESSKGSVTDVILRNRQGSVYGHQKFKRETYFQQRTRPGPMPWQGMELTTRSFQLEQIAHGQLRKDGQVLLL